MCDLISVVIPVYNIAPYLKKCLNSVLSQSYTNLQIIIIDDGSKDDSAKICLEFAKRDARIIFRSQENGGVSQARNHALSLATGQWVVFVDGDDWLPKDAIETLYKEVKEKQAQYAVGRFHFVLPGRDGTDPTKRLMFCSDKQNDDDAQTFFSALRYYSFACKKILNMEIIRQHNLKFPVGMIVSEDTLFNLLFLKEAERVVAFDKVVYYYNCLRETGRSASRYYPMRSYWAKECLEAYEQCLLRYIADEEKRKRLLTEYGLLRIQRDLDEHLRGCTSQEMLEGKLRETYSLLSAFVTDQYVPEIKETGKLFLKLRRAIEEDRVSEVFRCRQESTRVKHSVGIVRIRECVRTMIAKGKTLFYYGIRR